MTQNIREILEESRVRQPLPGARIVQFKTADSLAGLFRLYARRDGVRRPLTGWIPNIITNDGLNNFGYGGASATDANGWIPYCRVGTGSTAPGYSDGALDSHLAESLTSSRTYGTSGEIPLPAYRFQRDTYIFPQGTATGIIAEVGVGRSLAGGNLSTRALVVDELGDPATVPVLADEQLEVVYEIRTYMVDGSVRVGTITIDSLLYDTARQQMDFANSGNMNGTFNYGAGLKSLELFKDTGTPNNAPDYYDRPLDLMETIGAVRQAYGSGTYYRDSICTADTDEGEFGAKGVTAIGMIGYLSWWWMSFTQRIDTTMGIPHDNTNQLIVTCRHSWDRYEP